MTAHPFLRISRDSTRMPFSSAACGRIAHLIYSREQIDPVRQTAVILCNDTVIRRLNRRYRGKDRPTDVLSFTFSDDDLLGEIYISLPRCRIQAKRFGATYSSECLRMFVHGLLHLAGYDHLKSGERKRMESREQEYLSATSA